MDDKKPQGKASEVTNISDRKSESGVDSSIPATTTAGGEKPKIEAITNPATWGIARPRGDRYLRCADTLHTDCNWSITGGDEENLLGYLRAHAKETHGKNEFTPTELANARRAIHKLAA